ncbi:thioester reductase domain-containing protein [Streptomyces kanamyceticus]|uniref:NAD-dependent epimerase/dehydratase family protein n=1 Tax=Streptomyces kanamyceticus TaxID=1967 RepID=A0A5J6GJB0_STRKN|nr:thioester reductase domain-containing protein [Streptomyces kanamyceticus]QEU95960.1 NAD-dependent epimerase/dehydratase family protein [Streptomyces kanamyceticus]
MTRSASTPTTPTTSTTLAVPESDLRLPADISPSPTAASSPPADVLLTGATGYLGGYLLRALRAATTGTIRCLVRADDDRAAAVRLAARRAEVGAGTGAEVGADPGRVAAIAGDFTQPRFGLAPDRYQELAQSIGAVYHCGASVNMNDPYELARIPNVRGTVEVLRFAAYGQLKAVHHVSTMAVFISARACAVDAVHDDSEPSLGFSGTFGYPASKYVAEQLVRQAAARGLPAAVYRPPFVLGDSATGRSGDGEPLSTLMKVCVQLRAAPATLPSVPVCAVDHAGRVITALAPDAPRRDRPRVFNLHDPTPFPLNDAVRALRRGGHDIAVLPVDEWLALLRANRRTRPARSLYAMFEMLPYLVVATPAHRLPDLAPSRVTAMLAERGITAPPVDESFLDRLTGRLFAAEGS